MGAIRRGARRSDGAERGGAFVGRGRRVLCASTDIRYLDVGLPAYVGGLDSFITYCREAITPASCPVTERKDFLSPFGGSRRHG